MKNPEAKNEIVVYQPNETVRLEVRVGADTVWLNRQQLAQLFGRDIKTIGKHIANALKEELAPVVSDFATTRSDKGDPTVAKFATVQKEGSREVVRQVEHYNLEMITSVGYRVKSPQGVLFRRWANQVLKEYLLRGFAVNARLNQIEDKMDRRLAKHDADIIELKDKGIPLSDMIQSFQKQGWTGRITEDELKGKFHGSAYFGLMYLAMHEAGAKDWYQDSVISLGNVGSVLKVQFHHICPQALLKATNKYDKTEINDISNLAFIGGNTNRRISAEPPEKYLPKISEANRRAQCVPLEESLYPVANYLEFLSARRKLLVEMLNGYLDGI